MKKFLYLADDFKTQFVYQEAPTRAIETEREMRPEDVLMIGDSHSVNLGNIAPNGTRVNAEVGRNITEMPAILEAELERALPRVITIMGGTNDYLSPDTVLTNLEAMIVLAREHDIPVVVATLPPANGQSLEHINSRIRALGAPDVTVVDVAQYGDNMADNLHLADYGAPAADMLNAAYGAVGAEVNTIIDILQGNINPNLAIPDSVIEGAASRIADSIPYNLNLESIIDEALEEVGGIDGAEDVDAVADEVEALVAEDSGAELTTEEVEQLQTMNNLEFLELPPEERLRLITIENVTSEQVASGSVESLTFTFTFDGQYNEALWRDTTAGQTLPPEVRTVKHAGQTFSRRETSLGGEFFTDTGQRLKIHEGTALSDIETGDLAEIQARVDEQLAAFESVEEGEEARSDGEMLVARMAIERGVSPEFVMAAFVNQDHEIETETDPDSAALLTPEEAERAVAQQRLTPEYSAKLEHFLTDIDRVEGDFNGRFSSEEPREANRLNPNFAAFFLGEGRDESTINAIMTEAGYTTEEIEAAASYVAARQEFNSRGGTNPLNAEILESGEVEVTPEKQDQVNAAVEVALSNQARYQRVSDITGVPWELIAGIHYRESSANFDTYLHNGQPLGQRTTIVPAGILFHNWEEAAIDALQGGYGSATEGDLASQANFAERFNGMGYNNRGLNSPYVWAGTSRYESQGGMYVADGQFSQTARDPRVGVMPIVMVLRARQGKDNGGAPSED